jgi:hypothetical protein
MQIQWPVQLLASKKDCLFPQQKKVKEKFELGQKRETKMS